jgi:hypothetical protein
VARARQRGGRRRAPEVRLGTTAAAGAAPAAGGGVARTRTCAYDNNKRPFCTHIDSYQRPRAAALIGARVGA